MRLRLCLYLKLLLTQVFITVSVFQRISHIFLDVSSVASLCQGSHCFWSDLPLSVFSFYHTAAHKLAFLPLCEISCKIPLSRLQFGVGSQQRQSICAQNMFFLDLLTNHFSNLGVTGHCHSRCPSCLLHGTSYSRSQTSSRAEDRM